MSSGGREGRRLRRDLPSRELSGGSPRAVDSPSEKNLLAGNGEHLGSCVRHEAVAHHPLLGDVVPSDGQWVRLALEALQGREAGK